jgi:NADPH-dependent glutamate synthase beta subunit-like oxidoreductase
MVKLTINQQKIEVPAGSTILTAARQLGIEIPTMCFLEGYKPFTSCMICLVEEMRTGKMLPSCSALVEDGMVIETDNEKVDACRKEALELLLSEHVGDCLGPCHRTCPANMNIPLMLRQIARKEFAKALQTVKQDIALPAILGRICPAPCEKACRRKQHDAPVSICLLKRFVADVDLARKTPFLPECQPASGMKIAIVGTGPTGLAAAYYLQQVGYHCTLLEKSAKTAATLRENISEEILPPEVLDAEIALIQKLGATFQFQQELGRDFSLADLQKKFDTVILAIGTITENDEFAPGL